MCHCVSPPAAAAIARSQIEVDSSGLAKQFRPRSAKGNIKLCYKSVCVCVCVEGKVMVPAVGVCECICHPVR